MPAHSQSNTATQASPAERPRNLDPQRSAALRVLVIEDDPPVRDACLATARGMGFVTTTAETLNSARAMLPQPLDIVLLDVRLPGGDGLSLLDEIRTRHPSAIIVIMTAYATVDSAVEALRIGAGDYLAKPFTIEDLTSTLERAAEILRKTIQGLPPGFRTVFTLRDVENLSTEETAEALGLSVPAVKSRLLRARLQLRERLSRYFRQKQEGQTA